MKHKWHEEIKAWADGAEIEVKNSMDINEWVDCKHPNWSEGFTEEVDWIEYRIKPQPLPSTEELIKTYTDAIIDVVCNGKLASQPKEPQYLYAYQNVFDGNCELSIFSHKYNEQKPIGKIKLEVDDD